MSRTLKWAIAAPALLSFCINLAAQDKPPANVKQLTQFQILKLQDVRGIVQQAMKITSPTALSNSLAQIADSVWDTDSLYGRDLFTMSLTQVSAKEDDTEKELNRKRDTYRKILSLIAKRDQAWAKQLIATGASSLENAKTNLDIAEDLLGSDKKLAADFASRGIQFEITDQLVSFLKSYRQQDEAAANRLFLNVINRYQQQPSQDAIQFGTLGTYLFRSPYISPQDYQSVSFTRVGDIMFPNISTPVPNIDRGLVRSYIGGAVSVVGRPTDVLAQRQARYVLGYLLVPKAREFAPEYLGPLSGAMAASMSSSDIGNVGSEDAYRNVNKPRGGTVDEQIEEIEKNPDAYVRDQLYLDLAHRAWKAEDFRGASRAASKMDDKAVKDQLETLIMFGETRNVLKKGENSFTDAIPLVEKLPQGLEKSVLWLTVSEKAEKTRQPDVASYALDMALKSASQLSNENTPYILTFIGGKLADKDGAQAEVVLHDAVREFNKLDQVRDPLLVRKVRLDPLAIPFPLSSDGLTVEFRSSFEKIINGREDECGRIIDGLRDERIRGEALAALARSVMKKKEPKIAAPPKQGDGVIRVGEDGIRKSATKIVMPQYPAESAKKKAAGVVVAEVQYNGQGDVVDIKPLESPDGATGAAVSAAMKQWKFKPSQMDGKPVSIRGKITFYFSIGANGAGEVKNPKQYQ